MIHPTAEVQTGHVGEGTSIWQYCIILEGAKLGSNCHVDCHVFIENDVVMGDNVTVKSGVQLWDGVHLEDNVFVGPNVTFTNDMLPRSKCYKDAFLKTVVRRGASIGANATIIAGISIGQYAMIGAGSVVTKSVPDYSIWYGNPAAFKGFVCQCGQKMIPELPCVFCGKSYEMRGGQIRRHD